LAADVCSVLKRRGDRFDNDAQLTAWLDEDGVRWTEQSLAAALRQLEGLGRIVRKRVDQFDPDSMLPGVYAEPRIIAGREGFPGLGSPLSGWSGYRPVRVGGGTQSREVPGHASSGLSCLRWLRCLGASCTWQAKPLGHVAKPWPSHSRPDSPHSCACGVPAKSRTSYIL
jgi:hypothetical protein